MPDPAPSTKPLDDLAKQAAQLTDAIKAAHGSMSSIFTLVKDNIQNFDFLNKSLLSNVVSVGMLLKDTQKLNGVFDKFTENIQNGINVNKEFGNSIAGIASKIPAIGETIGKVITNFTTASTAAAGFESTFIDAAMSGGNFFELLSNKSNDFSSSIDDVLVNSIDKMVYQSTRMGVGLQEGLSRSLTILKTLPGEYNKVYTANVGLEQMSLTTPEMLSYTAKGVGIAFGAAADMASKMVATFGMNAEQASERIAFIGDTSKKLKMPFETIKGLVSSVDSAFALWGDQMQGTVSILGKVSQGLRDSGVGFEQQQKIVSGITTAISGMNFQTRAFIGLQAGFGRSAVGSGLKVERMLQEGKIGELANMMQQTIEKSSGGKAISLQEAEASPDLERRFMVQRQMMSSMFGIQDTATANRILEVMSKGAISGTEKEDLKTILSDTMTKGKQLTDRQVDYNSLIATNTQNAAISLKQIEMYAARRDMSAEMVGSTNKFFEEGNKLALEQSKTQGTLADKSIKAFEQSSNLAATHTAKAVDSLGAGLISSLNYAAKATNEAEVNKIEKNYSEVIAKLDEAYKKNPKIDYQAELAKLTKKRDEDIKKEQSNEGTLSKTAGFMEKFLPMRKLKELAERETPMKPEKETKKTMQENIGGDLSKRTAINNREMQERAYAAGNVVNIKNEPIDVHIVIKQTSNGEIRDLADKMVKTGRVTQKAVKGATSTTAAGP